MNYHKVLTRNDAGKHSHQSGFHVSKIDARSGLFPALDESLRNNPRCDLKLLDRESGEIFKAKFIFYNKSKNEYRVTGISSLLSVMAWMLETRFSLKKGNLLVFHYKRTSTVVDISSIVEKPKAVRRLRVQLQTDRTPSGSCDDIDLLLNPQKMADRVILHLQPIVKQLRFVRCSWLENGFRGRFHAHIGLFVR